MTNKKRIALLSLVIIVTAISVTGNDQLKETNDQATRLILADWVHGYRDIQELSEASDLIALVRVTELISVEGTSALPSSTFATEVIEAVYGSEPGQTVPIYMTGGVVDGEKIEIDNDPLLEAGQELLVFTQKNTRGSYTILGGPQGRLEYYDGRLYSLGIVNSSADQRSNYAHMNTVNEDASQLISEIKRIMNP